MSGPSFLISTFLSPSTPKMNFLLLSALFLSAAAAHRESFTIPNTVSGKYNSFQAEDSFSISSAGTPEEVALSHLETLVPGVKLQLHHDTYTDDDTGITHVYFTQTLDGFKVENAVANVNIRSDGSVLSAGTSLIKDISKQVQKRALEEIVEPLDALIAASKAVGYNIGTENAEVAEEDSLVGDQRTVEISNLEGVQDVCIPNSAQSNCTDTTPSKPRASLYTTPAPTARSSLCGVSRPILMITT